MTNIQSTAEELPNMHASTNWVSWQGTTGLLIALIECLTVLLEYFGLLPRVALPDPPLATPLPTPLDPPLNLFLLVL